MLLTEGTWREKVCDSLAEQGHTVVMPDVYRGESWDPANFPPPDFSVLLNWVHQRGSWEAVVKPDLVERVVPFLKNEKKVGNIGMIGFCWGAMICVRASHTEGLVQSIAGIHPSLIDADLVRDMTCPGLFCPAGNDPSFEPLKEVLDQKPFGDKCEYRAFPDMLHGWSVRGDLSDSNTARDVELVFDLVFSFFHKTLKQ